MPAGSRKQIENVMRSMTSRKRAKAVVSPQFPFLFPPALVCFLFPVCRRGKRETKAVSTATLPIMALVNCQGNEAARIALRFPLFEHPSFPFLFPLHAEVVNETAST